jgi:hypothetical protein
VATAALVVGLIGAEAAGPAAAPSRRLQVRERKSVDAVLEVADPLLLLARNGSLVDAPVKKRLCVGAGIARL